MKLHYQEPVIQLICITPRDVITTSFQGEDGDGYETDIFCDGGLLR